MTDLKNIDKSWTLFLDRDGVINYEKHRDYINTWEEFRFLPGAKEAIKIFTEKFGYIFIVTNQRGIAKGITKLEDLETIHKNLLEEIANAGGKITGIYFCGDLHNDSPNRKPNPGMGLLAKKEFPEVNFSKSVMIGNTTGDLQFGKNLGVAINIFVHSEHTDTGNVSSLADLSFPDLLAVSGAL